MSAEEEEAHPRAISAACKRLSEQHCKDALQMIGKSIRMTGVGHTTIMATRPCGEGCALGGLVFATVCPMSDADMLRFTDFAQAFMQDITSADGIESKKIIVIDKIRRGDA